MSEQHTNHPPHVVHHHAEMPEEHPERHEHSDVSVRGIWITVGAVFATTIAVMALLYVVFFAYEGAQARQDEAERRSAIKDVIQGPPAEVPRLQGIESFHAETPSADMLRMQAENKAIVTAWGQTPDGRKHIPISRAIEIAVDRPEMFPARAAGAGGSSAGATTRNTTNEPAGASDAGH